MHPVRGATNLKLGIYPTYVISIQCTPCGVQLHRPLKLREIFLVFQSNAPHAGCNPPIFQIIIRKYLFQSNAPHAGCNSKTIQSKRILVTRRMYSFANCVLYTLKHLPTYCIGTTLQPLIFGAKLPVILCSLGVRTILTALLYHTSQHPASAFVVN